jgi:hypothetical protein
MPATPKGLPYPAATEPVASGAANIQALASAVDLRLTPVPSTTPPVAPVDGQLWAIPVDAANGVVWLFRYNPAAPTYKWEFVGGPPWTAFEPNLVGCAANTPNSLGPALITPRAGEYLVGCRCEWSAASAGIGQTQPRVGGVDQGNVGNVSFNVTYSISGIVPLDVRVAAAAGVQVMQTCYAAGVGSNNTNRHVTLLPIRVS